MIVQCPDCASRFRLADDKLKPGGTKVRCSKCQKIFTVNPPAPEPSFDSPAEQALETEPSFESFSEQALEPDPSFDSPAEQALETEPSFESFSEQALEPEPSFGSPAEQALETEPSFETSAEPALQTEPNFADDNTETRQDDSEQGGVAFHEFDFTDEPDTVDNAGDSTFEDEFSDEFDFDALGADFGEESDSLFGGAEESGEAFDFGDDPVFEEGDAFSMGEDDGPEDQVVPEVPVSFEEEKPEDSADSMSFAFSDEAPEDSSAPDELPMNDDGMASADDDLFGEQSFDENDLGQLPPPQKLPKARKSGRKGLGLALLLFLVLGGLAGGGYFAWQKGLLDVNKVRSLLHLDGGADAQQGQIRTAGLMGSFVQSAKAGRLFVIRGEAINEYSGSRSAVAVKGMLFDATGKILLQQTAFCGNSFTADELMTLPFERIVEQMNNQFGDSLSNLNVPAGKSIPFTIVFRNLPPGLSEYSVEVVDSKPASR